MNDAETKLVVLQGSTSPPRRASHQSSVGKLAGSNNLPRFHLESGQHRLVAKGVLVKLSTLSILVLSAMMPILAETLQTNRGFSYENVTIKEIDLEKVKIIHSSGIGWVNIRDFTPESAKWILSSPQYIAVKNAADEETKKLESAALALKAQKLKAANDEKIKAAKEEQEKEKLNQIRADAIRKEFEFIGHKKDLWISDFKKLESLLELDKVFPGSSLLATTPSNNSVSNYFTDSLGKPDRERVFEIQTTTYDSSFKKVPGVPIGGYEYIYNDRLVNPTTGKKENLVLEFVVCFYRRCSASPSGNISR